MKHQSFSHEKHYLNHIPLFSGLVSRAQITHPCDGFPQIRDNYPLTTEGHSYIVETLLCDISQNKTMPPERVFKIMMENNEYIAPGAPKAL